MKEELEGCENCHIADCGILNKDECPLNKIWAMIREAREAAEKARYILKASQES